MSYGTPFDVSDILLDPDFSQTFSLARTTETIDTHGRTVKSNANMYISGCIHPATAEQLERVPEADRSSEIIAVYSTTPMTSGSDTLLPDLITWRSKQYRAVDIMDWSDYGAGFMVALCASIDMQGKAV